MNVHCPKCKAASHADADICSMCGHWLKPPAQSLSRPDDEPDVASEEQTSTDSIQLCRTLFRRYGPVAIGTAIGTCIGVILIVSLDIRGSDASTVVAVSAALGFVAGIFTMRLSVGLSVTVTALLLLVFLFFAVLIMDESRSSNVRRSRRARTEGSVSRLYRPSRAPSSASRFGRSWYQGGTLHSKSALEWQTAWAADKLATCADFVTKMWTNGNLKPSIANNISTVDDVRPYAEELVDFLDAAFKPDPDPEQNRKLFTNQTVSSTAAIGMITMGWTK